MIPHLRNQKNQAITQLLNLSNRNIFKAYHHTVKEMKMKEGDLFVIIPQEKKIKDINSSAAETNGKK